MLNKDQGFSENQYTAHEFVFLNVTYNFTHHRAMDVGCTLQQLGGELQFMPGAKVPKVSLTRCLFLD